MSSVAKKIESVESVGTPASIAAKQRTAALWAAVGYVAGKEGRRDDMIDGSKAIVNAVISGEVDGQEFEPISFSSILAVGHESERASSSLPSQSQLLAAVFAKLNAKTRAAVIREVSEEFAASGEYPAVADDVLAATEEFLSGLRQSKKQIVRGAVKVSHVIGSAGAAGPAVTPAVA